MDKLTKEILDGILDVVSELGSDIERLESPDSPYPHSTYYKVAELREMLRRATEGHV